MADREKAMDVESGKDHEEVEDEEDDHDTAMITKEMLKNPAVLSALQGKLDSMAGAMSGYIQVPILSPISLATSLVLLVNWSQSMWNLRFHVFDDADPSVKLTS